MAVSVAPTPPQPGTPEHALAVALAASAAAVAESPDDPDAAARVEAAAAVHAARTALVKQWTPWACRIASRWWEANNRRGDRDEWQQVAVFGLLDAAGLVPPDPTNPRTRRRKGGPNNGRFDPALGFGFSCYADGHVRKYLQEFAHAERCGVVRRPREDRIAGRGLPPLAPVLGFPDDGDGMTWEPAVAPERPAPDAAGVWAAVDAVLADPRERLVLWLRFRAGFDLAAIGRAIGLTRERVRQIQKRALDRLRERAGVFAEWNEAA